VTLLILTIKVYKLHGLSKTADYGGVFMAVYIPATVMPSLYLKVVGKSLGYPAYINFLGLQMPITSALIYMFAIAGLVSTPIFGYLGDKLGRKAVVNSF
jgi:MFS family permease